MAPNKIIIDTDPVSYLNKWRGKRSLIRGLGHWRCARHVACVFGETWRVGHFDALAHLWECWGAKVCFWLFELSRPLNLACYSDVLHVFCTSIIFPRMWIWAKIECSCLRNVVTLFHYIEKERAWRKANGRPAGFETLDVRKPIGK
jgi:hypothetical protein